MLRSSVIAAGGFALPSGLTRAATPRSPSDPMTVMTRNLYLGGRLVPVFETETSEEFERAVDGVYRDVVESRFPVRARRFVDEIAENDPDLVGLQEVSRFAKKGDGEPTEHDYLRTLLDELDDRGLAYTADATVVNIDAEFPAAGDSGPYRIRFVDRDVILTREDRQAGDPTADGYTINRVGVPVNRGYCAVTVDGSFTFVNTHLAVASNPFVQFAQALELGIRFEESPTVLVGDLNSSPDDPDTLAYDVLTGQGDYSDSYAAANPDEDGYTCCQRPDLTNDAPTLDRRIDHVLTRGGFETRWAKRVGHGTDDRIEGLWPSDHAGVVAAVDPP